MCARRDSRRRGLGGLLGAALALAVVPFAAWHDVAHGDPVNAPDPSALPPPPHVAAPPADATRTASGLAVLVLRPGSGTRRPARTDRVEIHYTGWTTDGRMFDSSVTRGRPATFPLSGVIEGFAEAIEQMVPGQRLRAWIPEDLAYRGRPGAPAGMLVFDIELIRIL